MICCMISGNSATNPPVLIVFALENYRYSITKGTYHLSELTSCQLPVANQNFPAVDQTTINQNRVWRKVLD